MLTLDQVQKKLNALRKVIYEEYDHAKIVFNFERSKLLYETYDQAAENSEEHINEFVETLGNTITTILSRHSKIDEYFKLLKLEHNLKYKTDINVVNTNENSLVPNSEEPMFFNNQSLYKNLETERIKKEKIGNFERIKSELSQIQDLFTDLRPLYSQSYNINVKDESGATNTIMAPSQMGEIDSKITKKIFEDCLFKLLINSVRQNKTFLVDVDLFSTYPEPPKVQLIYMALFVIAYKSENYLYCYKLIKRMCRGLSYSADHSNK